jgi:carbamoyl-phosphate synthase large subunit
MKIMVTGAGALLGQGIIHSLRRSSLKPCIVAVDPSPLAAGLYWADRAHLVPMATAPAYDGRIRVLLEEERPDAVLVGTDVELAYFASRRKEFEFLYRSHIVVSDARVVEIADDKWLTFCFLREQGFPAPDSALPADAAALVQRVGFPLVVKPRRGARSVGVHVVRNPDDLSRALMHPEGLVVQECVGTVADEYTAGLIVFEGNCAASITMRRDLRDGNTYRAFPIPDFKHDAMLRRIAERLRPHGPVNFQFRLAGGEPRIFEINGRFSGTTPLRGLVGFPEVEMVLRRLVKGEPVLQPLVRSDVILRHWGETLVPADRLLAPVV